MVPYPHDPMRSLFQIIEQGLGRDRFRVFIVHLLVDHEGPGKAQVEDLQWLHRCRGRSKGGLVDNDLVAVKARRGCAHYKNWENPAQHGKESFHNLSRLNIYFKPCTS